MNRYTRREFIKLAAGLAASGAIGFPALAAGRKRVVIVGGGAGGATAAKYLRRADSSLEVTLIEPNDSYYTCFMSNEVLGGARAIETLKFGYDGLRRHGVKVVHETVTGIDPAARTVTTEGGKRFGYDRAIVAPGISFQWGAIEGYDKAAAEVMPHAWKAGAQTELLRKQLEAMDDGGTVIIVAPPDPFRCPPGPYERACLIANYLKQHKPKSKVLILDAKDKFAKQTLFTQAWERHYKGMVEWVKGADTGGGVKRIDVKAMTVSSDFDTYKAAVANVIPPQKAGEIAAAAGLTDESGWCPVGGRTFESTRQAGIHVIGDSSSAAPMPKSAYAANSQAKVAAAAIADLLNGREPGEPSWINACYSVVAPEDGIFVSAVYRLGEDGKIASVEGAGGVTPENATPEQRAREVQYAHSWYNNITHDIFG